MRQISNTIKSNTANESMARTFPVINMRLCVLSIALYGSLLAYLISSGQWYSDNLCRTPYLIVFIVMIELFKNIYVRKTYQIDGTTKQLNNGGNRFESASRSNANQSKWSSLAKDVCLSCSVLIFSLLFYSFISMVLGAPYYQYMETFSLAAVLTTSTVWPIVLFIGATNTCKLFLSETIGLRTPLAESYLKVLQDNCIGVILGAWAASVVAPLDWDRPWQVYPVPNVVGAIGGALGANVLRLCRMVWIKLHERVSGNSRV